MAERVDWVGSFIDQQIRPLLFSFTHVATFIEGLSHHHKEIESEEQFWTNEANSIFGFIRLKNFTLTDWFPRTPGVSWTSHAKQTVDSIYLESYKKDPVLGKYFNPRTKGSLIEEAGLGTIRLRPRTIDFTKSWIGTALRGTQCHRGIPLVIPDHLLKSARVKWGDKVDLTGQVTLMQEVGLDVTASHVHHISSLIVRVERLKGISKAGNDRLTINPVVVFDSGDPSYPSFQYAFANCRASEPKLAENWLTTYAAKFGGRIVTNFDQVLPSLANAPLSYQRLLKKTYDRVLIGTFQGQIQANHIDQVIDKSAHYSGDHVGHNINVGGSANINIDSVLQNVTQTVTSSQTLDSSQKTQLESLVQSLKKELDQLKTSHPDETEAITGALDNAVKTAIKPAQERKKNILQLSAKGLKDAAELVKDIAPTILTTVDLIAKFIVGL